LFLYFQNFDLNHVQDKIAEDDQTHGAMFVPVVLGSDKTMVLVATGHHQYHPLYPAAGNCHNSLRRSHSNALSLLGFLAIPKSE
jgi:Plavaka transposase